MRPSMMSTTVMRCMSMCSVFMMPVHTPMVVVPMAGMSPVMRAMSVMPSFVSMMPATMPVMMDCHKASLPRLMVHLP